MLKSFRRFPGVFLVLIGAWTVSSAFADLVDRVAQDLTPIAASVALVREGEIVLNRGSAAEITVGDLFYGLQDGTGGP